MSHSKLNPSEVANKRFGQNFLKDVSVLEKIIEAMPNDNLPIVEIGPGLGDLTRKLVSVHNVTAFEVDDRLCNHLKSSFSDEILNGRFQLKCGDVLEQWRGGNLLSEPYRLIANLPYYIATNIILKAMRDSFCSSILVMVQKEVAQKFGAREGDKNFSALSVLAQSVGEAKIEFLVPPEAFVPPPKVDSAVLKIVKKRNLSNGGFEEFLKVCFKQPRKTLFKNLSSIYSKALLESLFDTLEIQRTARPHQVGTMLYHQLYKALKKEPDYAKESRTDKRKSKQKQ